MHRLVPRAIFRGVRRNANISQERGLYWIGPIYNRGGYGNAARNYLRGLKNIGYPDRAFDIFGRIPDRNLRSELPVAILRDIQSCDLYVCTDRASGWGVPCVEAMAMGKPAATIDWSGCTAFMNRENSLLIRTTGKLVAVDPRLARERPAYAGQKWAEVRIEEVRRVLRPAFERRDLLAAVGRRGMEDVRQRYSLESVAKHIVAKVESGSRAPWFRTVVPDRYRKFMLWKYIPY